VDEVVRARWEREQALLGLARDTSAEQFAAGGLAGLAVPPTARIVVLPGDPCALAVPPQDPNTVIPQFITAPGGLQLPQQEAIRGTSSGYVGVPYSGDGGLWRSFVAVNWHGGVDFFLGDQGGRERRDLSSDSPLRIIYLSRAVGWAWAAFSLQREIAERFMVSGPFRAIVAMAHAAGASLGMLGAGRTDPVSEGVWGQPTAVEQSVLLQEDLVEWPDETGVEALALRFGARLDLAFGGPGERHLDRTGPNAGNFRPR
jgi:hypothetical protein